MLLKQGDTKKDETAFQRPGGGSHSQTAEDCWGNHYQIKDQNSKAAFRRKSETSLGLARTKRDTGDKQRKEIIFAE